MRGTMNPPRSRSKRRPDEAWVDVVQNGGYGRSIGSTGRSDCPGLRKSVRFDVASNPIVLQISGASVDVISIVVSPVH